MGGVVRPRGLRAEGPPWAGAQTGMAHEPGDPVWGTFQAQRVQFVGHPGAAVRAGLAMGMDGAHLIEELLVVGVAFGRRPGARGVVTASGDVESFAEFGDEKLGPHGIDQRIPLCGSSESMLMAFFRISRWRRRHSFSR